MNVREIDAPHDSNLEMGFAGGDAWAEFVRAVYGYKVHRLVASDADGMRGALTLLEFKHPLFGHYLATAPYASYGGFAFEQRVPPHGQAGRGICQRARAGGRGESARGLGQ